MKCQILFLKQKFLEESQDRNHVKIFLIDRLINFDLEFVVGENNDHTFFSNMLDGYQFWSFQNSRPETSGSCKSLESEQVPDYIFRPFSVFMERMQYLLSTNDF